jgi:MFS transporter, CP family, cyanate transporter
VTAGHARASPGPVRAGPGTALAIVLIAVNLRTLFASLPPLLPDARDDLGMSAATAGLLATLPVACLGAFAPLSPRLAERIGIERLLVLCGGVTAVGLGLRGAGGIAALFAGTILAGVAIALAQAALPPLVRTRHPGQAGVLTGAFSMALTLGATVAAALAVPVEHALGGGWGPALAIWAVPAALAALLWVPAALRPPTIVAARGGPPLLRSPLAWSIAVFFGIQSMGFYAALSWLPSMLEDAGYSSGHAGALLAGMTLVQVPPAFFVPLLAARRESQVALLGIVGLLSVVGLTGILASPSAALFWVVVMGLGQGGALGLGLILPVLRGADGPAVAALTAMMLCVGYLLAALGPWLLGVLRDVSSDWTVPFVVLIAITASEVAIGLPAARARGRVGAVAT